MLIVFGGRSGTGKTTLSRALAGRLGAVFVRIDSIEVAIDPDNAIGDIGEAGYRAAYAVAEDNLRLGRSVVADGVNPVAATRAAWRAVAERAGAAMIGVEIVCSDRAEHRGRVERRVSDIAGFPAPTWERVATRHYEPWDSAQVRIDTAGKSVEHCLGELTAALSIAA